MALMYGGHVYLAGIVRGLAADRRGRRAAGRVCLLVPLDWLLELQFIHRATYI